MPIPLAKSSATQTDAEMAGVRSVKLSLYIWSVQAQAFENADQLMNRLRTSFVKTLMIAILTINCAQLILAGSDQKSTVKKQSALDKAASAFLEQHCVICHNAKNQEGDFLLADLADATFDPADNKRWLRILEMVNLGDMPPPDHKQPEDDERTAFEAGINQLLKQFNVGKSEWESELPRYANRVDHDALFSGEHKGPAFTKSRVWRINGDTYQRRIRDFGLGFDFVVPMKKKDTGFHDYSSLYADEATILTMKSNAKRVAAMLVKGKMSTPPRGSRAQDGFDMKSFEPTWSGPKYREIKEFLEIKEQPSQQQMEEVFVFVYGFLTALEPSKELTDRWVEKVLAPSIESGGLEDGLEGMIVSILLSPDFLFRVELGRGKELPDGRRLLSSTELAYALSYTLHNHPVRTLLVAAKQGKLETRGDVEREFRALYDNTNLLRGRTAANSDGRVWQQEKSGGASGFSRPKLVQFFQQYFGYTQAGDVFKDETRHHGLNQPNKLIADADWTVLHILAKDKNVLEELLTTNQFAIEEGRRKKKNRLKPGEGNTATVHGYQQVYNLIDGDEGHQQKRGWSRFEMPKGQRAGMLTHPAWLVAHSQNFHTDPVRRGKWILGHLLGQSVPELPIAAQAQLPEWHDKTIRERFAVVKGDSCWRCHKKMNPLGNPFEAYDDFGRFRTEHLVGTDGNIVESEFEKQNRRNPDHITKAECKIPVDTSGELFGTGDPELDGPVKNAIELMHKLAKSERVRQVFIRHVFRYFMGRNETLYDSPTLMAMDKAYIESGGSFKETLVALVTSDSFLTRR